MSSDEGQAPFKKDPPPDPVKAFTKKVIDMRGEEAEMPLRDWLSPQIQRLVSKISVSLAREEAVVTESVENAALDWRASHPPEAVFRRLALLLVVLLSFPYRFVSRLRSISDPRRDEEDHEPHKEDDDWHAQRLGPLRGFACRRTPTPRWPEGRVATRPGPRRSKGPR